jgi:hypothetical protein
MFNLGAWCQMDHFFLPLTAYIQPRTLQPDKLDVFSLNRFSLFSASFKQSSFKLALALCRKGLTTIGSRSFGTSGIESQTLSLRHVAVGILFFLAN